MTKKNRSSTPNLLASVDDIQKRLHRPSSLPSPQPSFAALYRENLQGHEYSSQLKVQSTEFKRKKETTMRKLEDYLDPFLLSAISAKIGRAKKDDKMETKLKRSIDDFEWPVDELKAFMPENSRTATTSNLTANRAVDLSDDVDLIEGCGGVEAVDPCKSFVRHSGDSRTE